MALKAPANHGASSTSKAANAVAVPFVATDGFCLDETAAEEQPLVGVGSFEWDVLYVRSPRNQKFFISYRRRDSAGWVGRLVDELTVPFGADNLFFDIHGIVPGTDFVAAINEAMDRADRVLVVIGPHWLDIKSENGARRLDDPKDHVRFEIAAALRRGIPTIPVLVGEAKMPPEDLIPEDVKGLARRQAVELRDSRWDDDIAYLIKRLGANPTAIRKPKIWLSATAIAIALAASLYMFGADMLERVIPPRLVEQKVGPTKIDPGEPRNFSLDLKRGGPVDVVMQSIVPDWNGREGQGGKPELLVNICSAEEGNSCPPAVQLSASGSRRRQLSSGPATIHVFNFNENPPVTFTMTMRYPD